MSPASILLLAGRQRIPPRSTFSAREGRGRARRDDDRRRARKMATIRRSCDAETGRRRFGAIAMSSRPARLASTSPEVARPSLPEGGKKNFPLRHEVPSMAHKKLLFQLQAREKILRGASQLTDAVRVTLGPRSKCVLIEKKWGAPLVCNDGVTIAKEMDLKDPEEDLGARMLRQAAERTGDAVGDGTSTSTVLAHSIYAEGLRNVVGGARSRRSGCREASGSWRSGRARGSRRRSSPAWPRRSSRSSGESRWRTRRGHAWAPSVSRTSRSFMPTERSGGRSARPTMPSRLPPAVPRCRKLCWHSSLPGDAW